MAGAFDGTLTLVRRKSRSGSNSAFGDKRFPAPCAKFEPLVSLPERDLFRIEGPRKRTRDSTFQRSFSWSSWHFGHAGGKFVAKAPPPFLSPFARAEIRLSAFLDESI
jgi:hypothetical protein